MGTRMSKEFDAEIDAILRTYKAVIDQAEQQALDARAAAVAFSKGWDACRTGVVLPTLHKIVATLAEKQAVANVAVVPNGLGLFVPYPARAHVRQLGEALDCGAIGEVAVSSPFRVVYRANYRSASRACYSSPVIATNRCHSE